MNESLLEFPLENATVECELFFPTRYLLDLLWRRLMGWNSNARLKIFAGRVFVIVK